MKRLVATLLLIGTLTMTQPANAWTQPKGPCAEDRYEITKTMPSDERVHRVKALIRCAFHAFDIGAEIPTAFAVIQRESGFRPWATNPVTTGVCRPYSETVFGSCGLAQHLARYWPGRARAYLRERWFPNTWGHVPVLQARANIIVTALIVKTRGWCDWTPPYCGG